MPINPTVFFLTETEEKLNLFSSVSEMDLAIIIEISIALRNAFS